MITAEDAQLASNMIRAVGTVVAALIVGVAGSLISAQYSRERDRQDKEGQWRSHAIELTKLDLQRKLEQAKMDPNISFAKFPIRQSVLDFLANYRDLQELDDKSPGELYMVIKNQRTSKGGSKTNSDEEG